MRITFIMPKFNLKSSTSNDILLKSKILKEFGHEITVITTLSDQNKIIQGLPFTLREEFAPSTSLIGLQIFAVGLLKKYTPMTDIFYLTSDTYVFGGGWYRRFTKSSKPVATYFNGYMDFVELYFKKFPLWDKKYLVKENKLWHRIRCFIERTAGIYLINKLDKFFVMSKTVAEYYISTGVRRDKVKVMPDFYDLDFLTIISDLPNPFEKYLKKKFHILFTGRIYIDKAADLLIEAFSKLNCINDCMLHIVGDGEMKKELEILVNNLGLSDKIIFHGWKTAKEIVPFYQYANLYVQPTRLPEPMNRATVEAMANGLPLVVTATSGEKWITEVAKTFKNGDAEGLRCAIEDVFKDEQARNLMSKNGRIRSKEFDYRILCKQLNDVLVSLNV